MKKKITIYTLNSEDKKLSKSFTTKKLASDSKDVLEYFGVVTTLDKESKTIEI